MKSNVSFDITRTTSFRNMEADATLIYHLVMAGAVRQPDRRQEARKCQTATA
jgi:hypothetical protein